MIYTLEEGKETDVTCEKEKQSKYMREICAAGIPDEYKIFHVRVFFLWIKVFFFACLQTLTFGHSVCSHAFKNDLSKIGYGVMFLNALVNPQRKDSRRRPEAPN